MKIKKSSSGFTLVELVVVVAILGIVAAVLVPHYIKYADKSRTAVCENTRGEFVHSYKTILATELNPSHTKALEQAAKNTGLSISGAGNTRTLTGGCPSDGTYTLEFSNVTGEITSFTCSKHDKSIALSGESAGQELTNSLNNLMSDKSSALYSYLSQKNKTIDSECPNSNYTKYFVEQLEKSGISISENTIWRVYRTNDLEYSIYIVDLNDEQKSKVDNLEPPSGTTGTQIILNKDGTYKETKQETITFDVGKNGKNEEYIIIANR